MSQTITSDAEEACPACGVMLDVGREALFSMVRCPRCRAEVRVRMRTGAFTLHEVLGQGGSGRVFRARDGRTDAEVALKVLEAGGSDYAEHLALLRNEAVCAGLIDHHRVVKVLGLEEEASGARLVMELMRGGSLHDLIVSEERIGEERVLRAGLEILKALAAGHAKGIVHRDIKPANILFGSTGGAKLGDYGLARSTAAGSPREAHLLATPDYVAPEMLGGSSGDFRCDLYSLGGSLHHALAGTPPYRTEGLRLEQLRILKQKPVRLASLRLSPATETLVKRMLDPDPAKRFGSHMELEKAIIHAMEGIGAATPRAPRRGNRGARPAGSLFRRLRSWWTGQA